MRNVRAIGDICPELVEQIQLAYANESGGEDVIPVEHHGWGLRLNFTPDQLQFIAATGYLPMTPVATAQLEMNLRNRGN